MDKKITLNTIKDFKKAHFIERTERYVQRVKEKLQDGSFDRFLDCTSYEVLNLRADCFRSFREFKRYTNAAVNELKSRGFKVKYDIRFFNSKPIDYKIIIFGW